MKQSNDTAPEGALSCGSRLRLGRESAGLTQQEASAKLKVPLRVIRALEADDWECIGAPVFVRGQLRSYARLVGVELDAHLLQKEVGVVAPPELVSHGHVPRYRRVFEQATRRAAYIAITAVIAVPVWLETSRHLSSELSVQSLEVPVDPPATSASGSAPGQRMDPAPLRTPLIASMGSLRSSASEGVSGSGAAPALALSFQGDSWVEVFDAEGEVLEQALLSSGDSRDYAEGEVGRVVLGNSAAVEVRANGKPVDVAAFSRANVARFALSSDGSVAPVEN
ncbi:RodZ domain-containing protein [Novilysobacter spongiicola]|uniref:Cytoskeleton protein RodZ n=1 Tax=Lysobacter spongiicola DSM 21749 TaxID=1122188 RepID=A0A1T4LX92_9GAMM|nr:RodZ domain-containing protein [Lysobacter spongiicola]SJZ59246.1 cytoskeleton protein RodZ [Lysobacter spongiicola DSM 21749]